MTNPVVFHFGPFRLDPADASLRRGGKRLPLMPKDFGVLHELVRQAGHLVTKDAMLRAVWPDAQVDEAVLKVCVRRVRRILGDRPDRPRFVETAHRRGYRFIAPVSTVSHRPDASALPPGRQAELDRLHALAERAAAGQRQVVFISGEPGIGKTTVLEALLDRLAGDARIRVARGSCVEHFGQGEAYRPVLEAVRRACQGRHGKEMVGWLRRCAPTWLLQIPALVPESERETLRTTVAGDGRDRMLRELLDAVATLGAVGRSGRLVVLALDDLQWSDPSSIDLVGALARGDEPVRLLVLVTHRPVGGLGPEHPLRTLWQELSARGRCTGLALEGISEDAVAEYLARRFGPAKRPDGLAPAAHLIRERTEGHPLFLINVVEDWLAAGAIHQADGHWVLPRAVADIPPRVPDTLQQLVEGQSERLTADEQRLLATASVVGREFSADAVAAGLEVDLVTVEEQCAALARRHSFIGAAASDRRPDRRTSARYRFLHALYQEVWYDGLTPARRARAHRRIGAWAERAYGARAGDHAAELALHFERAGDRPRAAQYHELAAQNASGRYAYREAAEHLTKALALLRETGEATSVERELRLQMSLGAALSTGRGFADPAVVAAYGRTWELARRPEQMVAAFPALCGFFSCHIARADLPRARDIGERLVEIARGAADPSLLAQALVRLGQAIYLQGDLGLAETYIAEGLAHYDPERDRVLAAVYGQDPAVVGLGSGALIAWLLGYPDRARERTRRQLAIGRELANPNMLAHALYGATARSVLYRDPAVTRELADELIALAAKEGFPYWMSGARIYRGWARVMAGEGEEGLAEIREGMVGVRRTGSEMWWPYFHALLAEAHGQLGQPGAGIAALGEAFASIERSGQREIEAELLRKRGQLLLLAGREMPVQTRLAARRDAEQAFEKAIDVARQRQQRSFELRAATDLARLWSDNGGRARARQTLGESYGWFTEGFDTADLRDAAALLAELG